MNVKYLNVAGIAASAIYIAAAVLALASGTGNGYEDLRGSAVYTVGCVVAAAAGSVFGLVMVLHRTGTRVFARISGAFIIIAAALLIIATAVDASSIGYAAIGASICAALAYSADGWISGNKAGTWISAAFAAVIIVLLVLFGLNIYAPVVIAVFVLYMAFSEFCPGKKDAARSSAPEKKSEPSESAEKTKVAPVVKGEVKPPVRVVVTKDPVKAVVTPAETESAPVNVNRPPEKHTLKAEDFKSHEPKEKVATDAAPDVSAPKPNVMSSREAAAVRDSVARMREAESVQEFPVCDPAVISEESDAELSEDDLDMLSAFEETPEVLLRRAVWNKGLRCRKDYGEHRIPIAFVKGKVAVFIGEDQADVPDEALASDGWTVLRYSEDLIADGKEQSEEICKAVKDNIRACNKSKRKGKR